MDNKGFQRLIFISLTAALAVTILLVAVLGWQFLSFQKTDEKIQKRNLILAGNIEKILSYHEMLTMSAKMVAATGDLKYVEKHYKAEEELDKLIKETIAIFPQSYEGADCIKETESSNRKLSEIEKKAFALVRNGRLSQALKIFNGTEYNEQERIYSQGIDKAVWHLKTEMEDSLREERKIRLLFFVTSLLGGIVVFISWILSIRAIRKWEKERTGFEEILGKSEEKYRTLIETTNTGYLIVDSQGKVIDANSEYVRLSGHRTLDEILGRSVIEWTAEHDLERNAEEVKKCGIKGFVRDLEIDYVNKKGKITPIEINATVIETQEGLKILTLCRDITERKRAEEFLRQSHEFVSTVLNSINDLIAIIDVNDYRIVGVNNSFLKEYQLKEKDVIGKTCYEVTHKHPVPCTLPECICPIVDMLKTGKPVVVEHLHYTHNGERLYVEVSASPIRDKNGKIIQAVHAVRNITERKKMEDALRTSEQSLKTIFSSMKDGLVETDLEGKILRVNNFFCELLGYKPEELVGKSALTYYPKEDWKRIKESFERFMKEESSNISWELNLRAKNGDLIPVSSRRTLLKDKDGKPISVMAIFRDIREMKLLQGQLLQAEKLSATGVLISGVAHELNNPLTGIIGYSEILQKDDRLPAQAKERIKTISQQANRCKDIILNLLKFARKYENKRTSVDINEVIDSTLNLNLYEMETTGIKVIKDFKKDIPKTFADLNQLQQVILNLIQNAKHAMLPKAGGEKVLTIKTESVKDKIIIEISDTGGGISEKNISKIFDPFFTTKDVGKGTGLGLSVSHGIVKEHGGDIRVRSKEGEGTTFTVELPAINAN